jgi:hypothetical protein
MPLNLETLPAREAEALAYAEGYTGTARLFARIDDLQKALGDALAENEALRDDLAAARYDRAYGGDND